MLAEYARYLSRERGLSALTIERNVSLIGPFLAERVVDGRLTLDALTAADVTAFLLARGRIIAPATVQRTATAPRTLLGVPAPTADHRFSLVSAVPAAARSLQTQPLGLGVTVPSGESGLAGVVAWRARRPAGLARPGPTERNNWAVRVRRAGPARAHRPRPVLVGRARGPVVGGHSARRGRRHGRHADGGDDQPDGRLGERFGADGGRADRDRERGSRPVRQRTSPITTQ
jgi:hypothetical protein